MAAEHLLATLEQTLRQTRLSRGRLASRLKELEQEAESLKAELTEMDELAAQTEETLYRFMSNVLGSRRPPQAAPRPQAAPASFTNSTVRAAATARRPPEEVAPVLPRYAPTVVNNMAEEELAAEDLLEAQSDRFTERTIPQATAALLREAGGPLHVNDIYQHLREGGFTFSGHNPTISIAVSLNRNRRFRKVAPGTFDLVMREASAQAS